jgi:molybdate transport system ATP-binding protein
MITARFAGRFGSFMLDVGFTIPGQGVTGLFGPSGCGKSTLLRCLAGLARVPNGYLRVGDEVWQEAGSFLPPYRRPIGLVFQDSRLFAHLNVRQNLRFGLNRAGAASRLISEEAVIGFLGLAGLLGRVPAMLSGGERQRVAIGRALLAQPRLLLLDEPLAALDRDAAHQILPKLRTISSLFDIPIVYVSHDMAEMERLADHLVLMHKDGHVAATGALAALLTDLALPFAAEQEAAVVLELRAEAYDQAYGLTACGKAGLVFFVPGHFGPAGTLVRLRICASDVSIAREPPRQSSILNVLPACILEVENSAGPHANLVLGIGDGEEMVKILSRITLKSWDNLGLRPGDAVFAQIKGMALAESR